MGKRITKITQSTAQEGQISRIKPWMRGVVYVTLVGVMAVGTSAAFFVIQGERIAYTSQTPPPSEVVQEDIQTFPVSVIPRKKEIVENPDAERYFEEHISDYEDPTSAHVSFFGRALSQLALMDWYQNLASVSSRLLVIQSGERKEQVAANFGKILKWTNAEKQEFLTFIASTTPFIDDGKFFPGTYTVNKDANPRDVAELVTQRFEEEVLARYTKEVAEVVPLEDTLIIASLIEREAYDFTDMRQISGVIWNRLFADMKLQIDATLQYTKGSKPSQPWWPKVIPSDKNLASAYNTYKNKGLPPGPIANPSLESILAALNPVQTDCMYYFHDEDANFYCTETYEEHVAALKKQFGRGK